MIKNILVIRNDRFGEFILNIPTIRALKEAYPQSSLSLAVESQVCELAKAVEWADSVLDWERVKNSLRKYRFDLAVVLNPTKEAHQKIFWAGIPVRLGYDRKWGILLTHKIKDTKHLGNRHEVDCNLELIARLGINPQGKELALKVEEGKYKYFINQKIVMIHPFTSDPIKQWPWERFEELAQRIRSELDLKVVIVGKTESKPQLSSQLIDMVNQTTLPELAALLKRASVLVTADSGPMHLAAAVGTRVVALFRNDYPGKTAQRWGPWGSGHRVIEKANLVAITVEEVFNQVKEVLS